MDEPRSDRRDPDQLLEQVQRQEEQERRGKLKIFFGASAGVGKTFAMLSAAQVARKKGENPLVGIAETHGRKETAALLEGLDLLPLREIPYQGKVLKEFDLDATLSRKPGLVLVDELAHSNAPGSRHPKRWQDVEELLQAGINVYTTLNVQHLESLNDIVGGITGIRVSETLPDKVFNQADDVVLVDIPPDELLHRLREGKVYQPRQAEQALRNFFNKGNLIALRELALRRTADRVDTDVKVFRASQSISPVWATREVLLVGVGPFKDSENAIRAAARLAGKLEAPWHAVHVETPAQDSLPESERQSVQQALKLARELGAETAEIPGRSVAETLVEYARSRNISRVVLGRKAGAEDIRSWRHWLPAFMRTSASATLAHLAPELDVMRIAAGSRRDEGANHGWGSVFRPRQEAMSLRPRMYVGAALACALTTAIATALFPLFDLANIAMLFLLTVVLIALRMGRGPSVLAAFLSVAAFDYFFVTPRFTFAVSDVQYLLTFAVMLAVALITGHLTAGLRHQARVSARREARTQALYEMARDLSGVLVREQVAATCTRFLRSGFRVHAVILVPDASRRLVMPQDIEPDLAGRIDLGVAQWAFEHGKPAGAGTDTLPGASGLYLPLMAPMRTRGVLAVEPDRGKGPLESASIRQIEVAASLIAIALERVHYVDVAQDALVRMESERLRNALLAAMSHDIRTPLTSLVGFADALSMASDSKTLQQAELIAALREEAGRMSRLVHNLLDMARLTSGNVQLHLDWQSVEETVGGALHSLETLLRGRRIRTTIPPELPLVRFDAVLIERVLVNLLENAVKYTPSDSEIRIAGRVREKSLELSVEDDGPGIPRGMEERIFEKFTRGNSESAMPGMGLGLSICRAIVEVHGGKIRCERSETGGARFVFTLPLTEPPVFLPESPDNKVVNAVEGSNGAS